VNRSWQVGILVTGVLVLAAVVVAWTELPVLGAGGLLHPARHPMTRETPAGCRDESFAGAGVTLTSRRKSFPICAPSPPNARQGSSPRA
jgi:hypothetical protein